jgi:hypothetical protein
MTIRAVVDTAVNWGKEDPGSASEWVETLSESDAKQWARKNLAATWSDYDPDAMEQWLGTLPADAQTEVNEFLEK